MPVKKTEKKPAVKKVAKKTATKAAPVKAVKEKKVEKVVKEVVAKETVVKEVAVKAMKKTTEKYFYAVGRRKTSIAQVRLFEMDKATEGDIVVNGKKMNDYFPTSSLQNILTAPLKAAGMHGMMRATVLVRGGGTTGQVQATQLGIARALVVFKEDLKKTLKDLGLLTRDSRVVERKKPGLKKARRAPQWAKR